jgi:benzylsuccinate CoA-transferase BbsF subunit
MARLPLEGVRVADFTWIGAGSYTTKLLADFGADVIKVESSKAIDPVRATGPFKDGKPGVNRSGYFADRNTSKRAMTLNLKNPKARELARKLIAGSDIVANNFAPGTMEGFGLGYADVTVFKSDIIYISMSMQGASGPDAGYVGFGLTIGALCGMQYLAGPPDREPAGTGTNYPDHVPNPTHGAFAVLAALRHKRRTGQGQFIDFAQTEPTIALLGPELIDYTVNGRIAERRGNDNRNAAPRGAYPCKGKDRWIAISVYTDEQWRALVEVLAAEHALGAAQWRTSAGRYAERRQLDALMGTLTVNREAEQLMHALQARGVPAGVVQNAQDLIDHDPQLAHRGHWVRLPHKEMGTTIYNAPPFHLSRTPADLRRAAPLLGEHTEEICTQLLGVDAADLATLRAEGVFD